MIIFETLMSLSLTMMKLLKLTPTDQYNHSSLRRMGYTFIDGVQGHITEVHEEESDNEGEGQPAGRDLPKHFAQPIQPILLAQPSQFMQFDQQSSNLQALSAPINALEMFFMAWIDTWADMLEAFMIRHLDEGFVWFDQFIQQFYHQFPLPP